ncbi:MAG: DUF2752 domain-containing protein [Flavobacteriaceae bacterium]
MTFENYMFPCLSKSLFGLECMGCGFQRSLLFVFQGKFTAAFWMYPAIYPLLILALLIILTRFFKFKFYQKSMNIFSLISIGTIITNYIIKQFIL